MTPLTTPARYLINNIDPYEFEKEPVGQATLYRKNVPWSSVIHVRVLFSFGALHDTVGKEGIAHFLEHMIFRGNPMYKDKFEIDQFSKKFTLDTLNAFTSFNCVCVHFKCLPEYLKDALAGIEQMILHSYLREDDVTKEKEIITQEAWGRYKNEKHIEYIKKESHNLFQDMPDRLRISSPLGWPDTIGRIERDDLVKAEKYGFTQKNMSFVVTGLINEEHIQACRDFASRFPVGEDIKALYIPTDIKAPLENTWVFTQKDMGLTNTKQAHVALSCSIYKKEFNPAIRSVASNFMYELLFQNIRNKNSWCYKVDVAFGTTEDYAYGHLGTSIDSAHIEDTLAIIETTITDVLADKYLDVFEQEKKLTMERRCASEITTDDIADYAIEKLRRESAVQTRKDSFTDLEAVTYEDMKNFLTKSVRGKTKLIEVNLPDECSVEDVKNRISASLL